jgi:PAS domain S-box-containing protein
VNDLLRQLWDETPDAVLAVTADGTILHWNRAAEAIFGYSSAEAVGHTLANLIVPSERLEEERSVLRDAVRSGVIVYESVRRCKDGSLVHVSISTKAVNDADGRLSFICHTKKDVTHLKVLRDSKLVETRFRDLLESTPDAIVMVNVTGRIVLVNSQAEKVFGYARNALIGMPVEMLLPERYRVGHHGHRANFFAQPRTRTMGVGLDLYGLRNGGDEFPVEISLSPLVTEEGTMVMSAVRDITDRKKAEQKFRGLLESAPDAMVIVGRDGRIALVNSQTERLFGYRREDLLGQMVEILVPERYRAKHPGHRHGFFSEPRARSMGAELELHGLRSDGTEFPVEVSLSPLETEEGVFVSSAIRDVTERKRYEQALHEANRLKSEFLANMSHELRTPLNGIIGFSEFLIDGKPGDLNAKQKVYLADILGCGRHLLKLINDILDLSKIEAGKLEFHPEKFSLLAAVEEVRAVVSAIARDKGITIGHDLSVAADIVNLDRQRLIQVLYNLLSNAVKFTDEGGEVFVSAEVHGLSSLCLRVRDTGIGISPEDICHLFKEFRQLDAGPTRRYGGTGLGLALTKKIVEAQLGSVSVESNPGQGSVFTVTLPFTDITPLENAAEPMHS